MTAPPLTALFEMKEELRTVREGIEVKENMVDDFPLLS